MKVHCDASTWEALTNDFIEERFPMETVRIAPFWTRARDNNNRETMNEQFKIENGIPIGRPPRAGLTEESKALRDTMDALTPDQSFLIPCADDPATQRARGLINIWRGRLVGKKFVTRRVENGVRVWRTE